MCALLVTATDVHVSHALRFSGDHDLDDVPEALERDKEHTDNQKPPLLAGAPEDDRESHFEHGNWSAIVITGHEWEQELTTRAATPEHGLAWTNQIMGGLHLMGELFRYVLVSSVCIVQLADTVW